MNRLKYLIVTLILIFLAIGAVVLIHELTITADNTTAVVQEMKSLNRWETASFTIEKVIDTGTNGNVFQQFLFGNRILLVAHGEVIAGFDLSKFSKNDIAITGSSITITLSSPVILSSSIDNSKTEVYDRNQGLLVPFNNNLETEALASAQSTIKAAACQEGILNNASANAKSQLTSILSSFNFTHITINIPQGHC